MNKKHYLLLLLLSLLFVATPVMAQDSVSASAQPEVSAIDTTQTGWVAWVLEKYDQYMGYPAVGALMAIESSFIPFPSELVIPPAVLNSLEEDKQSNMIWWMIVIVGTLGALVGALINYYLALWLGRPIIYKFANSKLGHLLQLSQEKIERAEVYFNDHGAFSTLVGRLIPVIRQLISLPAGLARMNIWSFIAYTTLGAFLWNCVLALLGYLGHLAGGIETVKKYNNELSIIILALVAVVAIYFVIRYFIKKRKNDSR